MKSTKVSTRLSEVIHAWEALAPETSFAGLTLAQFKEAVAGSLSTRETLSMHDRVRRSLMAERASADRATWQAVNRVVRGIRGNPDFGESSGLYRALGYKTPAERKSGLTRMGQPNGETGLASADSNQAA